MRVLSGSLARRISCHPRVITIIYRVYVCVLTDFFFREVFINPVRVVQVVELCVYLFIRNAISMTIGRANNPECHLPPLLYPHGRNIAIHLIY
jgi:hypothetical protein